MPNSFPLYLLLLLAVDFTDLQKKKKKKRVGWGILKLKKKLVLAG